MRIFQARLVDGRWFCSVVSVSIKTNNIGWKELQGSLGFDEETAPYWAELERILSFKRRLRFAVDFAQLHP